MNELNPRMTREQAAAWKQRWQRVEEAKRHELQTMSMEQMAWVMGEDGVAVGPLQVAALLLERAVAEATETSHTPRHASGGPVLDHEGAAAQANQRQRKARP